MRVPFPMRREYVRGPQYAELWRSPLLDIKCGRGTPECGRCSPEERVAMLRSHLLLRPFSRIENVLAWTGCIDEEHFVLTVGVAVARLRVEAVGRDDRGQFAVLRALDDAVLDELHLRVEPEWCAGWPRSGPGCRISVWGCQQSFVGDARIGMIPVIESTSSETILGEPDVCLASVLFEPNGVAREWLGPLRLVTT